MAAESLEEMCSLIVDCPHKTAPIADAPFGYAVGTTAIDATGQIDFAKARPVDQVTYATWTTRAVPQPGDLIFCREAPVGPVAIVPDEINVCLGQRTMLLRPNPERLDHRWLAYWLRSPSTLRAMLDLAEGSTVAHVNVADVRRFKVVAPPLAEQRAIADVLGALGDKIASNGRLADAADAAWLCHGAHSLREASAVDVQELLIEELLVINDGYRAKNSELSDEGVAFVRAGNLTDHGLDLRRADRVPHDLAARVGVKRSLTWDTAFTSKGTVGRITLVSPDADAFVYSPQVCFWRSLDHERLSPFVLNAWMRSPLFTAQIDAVKGQTDMADYVSLRDQRAMRFDLPEPSAQAEVTALAKPLARKASMARKEARTLGSIREALLPRLISGQIRVSLSSDVEEQIGAAMEALV